jgi:hypothetical protein
MVYPYFNLPQVFLFFKILHCKCKCLCILKFFTSKVVYYYTSPRGIIYFTLSHLWKYDKQFLLSPNACIEILRYVQFVVCILIYFTWLKLMWYYFTWNVLILIYLTYACSIIDISHLNHPYITWCSSQQSHKILVHPHQCPFWLNQYPSTSRYNGKDILETPCYCYCTCSHS